MTKHESVPQKTKRLRPGDILAIPIDTSVFGFILYVTDNCFGTAIVVLEGTSKTASLPKDWVPKPLSEPMYCDNRFVETGRWKPISYLPLLLQQFPANPPLYHEKTNSFQDDDMGPFGCAESVDGSIRDLSQKEALAIGLLNGTYRQVVLGDSIEEHVKKLAKHRVPQCQNFTETTRKTNAIHELSDLCFADDLARLPSPLRTQLTSVLSGLRDDLVSLPESAGNRIKLRLFKKCVEAINRVNENLDIDTADREDLCELLFKVARLGEVRLSSKFVDELRDW